MTLGIAPEMSAVSAAVPLIASRATVASVSATFCGPASSWPAISRLFSPSPSKAIGAASQAARSRIEVTFRSSLPTAPGAGAGASWPSKPISAGVVVTLSATGEVPPSSKAAGVWASSCKVMVWPL